MVELTIIIPTFNEVDNITCIIHAIDEVLREHKIDGEILVVDDQSQDGTIEKVKDLAKHLPHVKILVRTEDHGLSQSVVEGFQTSNSPFFLVMDADSSHPPTLIPRLVESLRQGADIAIGSRYVRGGGIKDWPIQRRVVSLGAAILGRIFLPQIGDSGSGFFAVRQEVVRGAPLRPRGFRILFEILTKGQWTRVVEIPFLFVNREVGESKMKPATFAMYIDQMFSIIAFTLRNRNNAVWREWKTAGKFVLVGVSGIVVNMGLLYFLSSVVGLFYIYSGLIAIECSIISNFVWNDLWTFHGSTTRVQSWRKRCVTYHAISFGGLLINFSLLISLTEIGRIYYLTSNLIGIFVAFAWNFFMNRAITWR